MTEKSIDGRAVEFTTVKELVNDKIWEQIEEILIDDDRGYLLDELFDYPELRDVDGQAMTNITVRVPSSEAHKITSAMLPDYRVRLTLERKEPRA